jgi:predicted acyl esterase
VRNLTSPVRSIIGPWIHKYPHFAAPEPRIGFLQEALRWWDRWLKDIPTGVEDDPAQRLYVMHSVPPARWVDTRPGYWIGVDDPAIPLDLPLGDGQLGRAQAFSTDVQSPQTCGDGGGEYFPFAFGPELPGDQTADDAHSACFDGQPLRDPLTIVGMPRLRLTLTPRALTGQIAVRLCDLRPDGTSALISHGFLNLRHHGGHENPQDLTPGKPIDVGLTLDNCAYEVPAGHRLRLAVSTAYWPFIWPAPDAGGVTLTAGGLALPLAPIRTTSVEFPPPEAAPPWDATQLRAPSMTRDVSLKQDGTQITCIRTDNGEMRDDLHGLATGSACVEEWSIHPDDPLSACANITWRDTMQRADWSVRTKTTASLTASRDTWHMRASLKAYVGDTLVFSRDYDRQIARDGI